MTPFKFFHVYLFIIFTAELYGQSNDYSYYKASAIMTADFINRKFDVETKEAVDIYIKKDEIFNTYIIYYTNKNRRQSFNYFQTYKGQKYTIASNANDNIDDNNLRNFDFNLFYIGDYFMIDQIKSNKKLILISVGCKELSSDIKCNIETNCTIFKKYTINGCAKISKNEFSKKN